MTDSHERPSVIPRVLKDHKILAPDEPFRFDCHRGLSCFTHCCADVNILLTPVDVMRLARHLKMSTSDFLERHTLMPVTRDLHLPVVMLRMEDERGKRCPFVTEEGCSAYAVRPWSCRMYPLGMGIPPARAGVETQPVYFLFDDDFCLGKNERSHWTTEKWRKDQEVCAQEEMEAGFRELVSHPWFIGGRQLEPRRMEMFYTACYDLTAFRRFIFESSFLTRFELDDLLINDMKKSDEALLEFAFRWLRFALFGEPTMKTRAAV